MSGRVQISTGEAAEVMRGMPARSVDMVYLDPPYCTQQVWSGPAGSFDDRWQWDGEAERRLEALGGRSPVAAMFAGALGRSAKAAYAVAMADILVEAHRLLRLTGCLWLQADDAGIFELKVLLDAIFGPTLRLGDVIWRRSSGMNTGRRGWTRVHDTLVCYARATPHCWRTFRFPDATLRPAGRPYVGGVIEDISLGRSASERVGYPTQKPLALLERLIVGSTLPDDVVLDPVMGSGTTLVAAIRLRRRAVGIDRSADAVDVARARVEGRSTKPTRQYPSAAQHDLFAVLGPALDRVVALEGEGA